MHALKALLIAVMSLGLVVFVIWFAWTAIKNAFGFGGRSRGRGGYGSRGSYSGRSGRSSRGGSYSNRRSRNSRRDEFSDYDDDFDEEEFERLCNICYDLNCSRYDIEVEYRYYSRRGFSIFQMYDFIKEEYGEL